MSFSRASTVEDFSSNCPRSVSVSFLAVSKFCSKATTTELAFWSSLLSCSERFLSECSSSVFSAAPFSTGDAERNCSILSSFSWSFFFCIAITFCMIFSFPTSCWNCSSKASFSASKRSLSEAHSWESFFMSKSVNFNDCWSEEFFVKRDSTVCSPESFEDKTFSIAVSRGRSCATGESLFLELVSADNFAARAFAFCFFPFGMV
mmetsp:Transcript_303/g.1068  ORF Transcript_303/g.1068 Transcript_303/m.1068 type:complete len:205 (+) Transcript_303:1934-2548(+)